MPASQETTPPQVANLLRSQDVAPVQRQQQQSGLPSGQDLGPSQQQQGSHDSASNQPQHLSIGLAATGEVPNTSVNAVTFQQGQTGINPFPPPLDKTRFEQAFRAYCAKKDMNVNLRQLQIDNRPVDLYQLHRNVVLEFGVSKVEQKALWDVIGGRMGFVQFSGTETEPPKSGPGVAQQLAHIYKELLAAFDHYYISAVVEARLKAQAQMLRNPAQMSPQMMQSVLTYAHMTVSELHRRGVPEKIITFVEANRVNLQRTYAEQKSFQSRFRQTNQNDAQGSGDQNGPSGGFLQQQNGLNLLEGNNFLDNRQRSPQHGPPMQTMRPTKELLEKSQQFVQNVKRGFSTTTIPSMPTVDVPLERQAEYLSLLNTLHAQCLEIEPKLAMYLVFTGKDEPIKRLAAIICTVAQQKSYGGSRFIVTLDMLQKMLAEIKRMTDGWAQIPFAHQQPQLPRPNDAQGLGDQMDHLAEKLADSLLLEDSVAQKNAAASELDPLQGNSFPDNPPSQHLQQGLPQPGPPIQPMQITKEYLEKALEFLRNVEQDVMTTIIPSMAPVDVPAEGQTEHDTLLDAVSAQCAELQPKLAAYLVLFGEEDLIRRLVATICIVVQQKSFGETRYITTVDMLQNMSREIKEATDGWASSIQNGLTSRQL